ncbi:Uncharacterized protein dnm_083760 [Desulfonema magnum]|uniref:Uncharacterized protein n=1 Tax=Desulfonema magnum TaxID=45655 RepID=A0A975BVZ1_9BACT|nr:Uncharacterized protein dnm_083760 [Desulfonema magnum]
MRCKNKVKCDGAFFSVYLYIKTIKLSRNDTLFLFFRKLISRVFQGRKTYRFQFS